MEVELVCVCVCVLVFVWYSEEERTKTHRSHTARGGKKSTNLRDRTPSADVDQSSRPKYQ